MKTIRRLVLSFVMMTFLLNRALHAQDTDSISGAKAFSLTGQIGIHTIFYGSEGIDPRRKSFSWYLTGAPVLKIYNITVPLAFLVGEQERDYRQSFDQVSITPTYKWIKVHLGYMNVTWSPFSWGGHTMFGAGIELNPARFRFGFLYGRLNRPVAEDTLSVNLQTPAFRRTGFACKLGYGTDRNFADIIFLKARDDVGSIPYVPVKTEVMPGENAVLGLASHQRIGKYFQWDVDAAISGYTRDLRSDRLTIGSPDWGGLLKSILDVRTSTVYYTALQSDLVFHIKNFKMNIRYRRVDPDYQSMGTYYFQSDVENITLGTSFGLIKNRLRFDGTIGRQHDNLLNKKLFTSTRIIGSASMILNLKKYFGMTVSYANYSSSQGKGTQTPTDSIRQSYSAQNITIMPRFSYFSPEISHLLLLTYTRQWFDDHNKRTASFTQYLSYNLNGCYSLSFPKKVFTLTITFMMNILTLDTNKTNITGFSVAGSKSFFKNRFQINLMANYSNRKNNGIRIADILNITLGATCRMKKHHGITAMLHYLKNAARFRKYPSFSEAIAELGYTYTF